MGYYNGIICNSDSSVKSKILIFDLAKYPQPFSFYYQGKPLERTVNLNRLKCGPSKPILIYTTQPLEEEKIKVFVRMQGFKTLIYYLKAEDSINILKYLVSKSFVVPKKSVNLVLVS